MTTRSAYVRPCHDTLSSSYRRLADLQQSRAQIRDVRTLAADRLQEARDRRIAGTPRNRTI